MNPRIFEFINIIWNSFKFINIYEFSGIFLNICKPNFLNIFRKIVEHPYGLETGQIFACVPC